MGRTHCTDYATNTNRLYLGRSRPHHHNRFMISFPRHLNGNALITSILTSIPEEHSFQDLPQALASVDLVLTSAVVRANSCDVLPLDACSFSRSGVVKQHIMSRLNLVWFTDFIIITRS